MPLDTHFRVFSTCPHSSKVPKEDDLRQVVDTARWSEGADCLGMLVYTDNGLLDPWLVAQVVLQSTERMVLVSAEELAGYLRVGDGAFILAVPASAEAREQVGMPVYHAAGRV